MIDDIFEDWDDMEFEDGSAGMDFIKIIDTDKDAVTITYIDFLQNEQNDLQNEQNDLQNEQNRQTISLDVFTKRVDFAPDVDISDCIDLKNSFVEKVLELCERNSYDIFNFKYDDNNDDETMNKRVLLSKMMNASNFISFNGRLGPANSIIISKSNYDNFGLSDYTREFSLDVLFSDIDDIIMYRKNNIDQPGLVCVRKGDKCKIVDIGFFPEKQFIKIKIENES